MILEVPEELFEKARVLCKAIKEKEQALGIKNKFVNDKASYDNESSSLFIGFVGEFAFARLFGLPEPVLVERYRDDCDFVISGKKIDLKTKLVDKRCYVNLMQYSRKKMDVDIYVFGELYGKYYRVIGWIEYDMLPAISNLMWFPNGSQGFRIKLGRLKRIEELIQPEAKSCRV